MIFEKHDFAGAVYLFSERKELIRELNYAEFEALLDGYVPAVDLANRELNAVYVEINSQYKIVNTVFFLVRFTSRGFVDRGWSVPILGLTQQNKHLGPDLGAGPIGLACASHCSIKHVSQFLWDPDLVKLTEFKALKDAVGRNRISIQFKDAGSRELSGEQDQSQSPERFVSSNLKKEFDKELHERLSLQAKQNREKMSGVKREQEMAIADVKRQYNARIDKYHEMLEDQKLMLAESKSRNAHLKETIDGQTEKIQGLREYYELKLDQMDSSEPDRLEDMKKGYEVEQEAAIESATKDLSELLEMREVEILYRNEQEAKLHEEIASLREENQALINNSGNHLLSRMLERGISFVTYQPGAGHITLPVSEIPEYMENPPAYVADKCGVSQTHYAAWLEHYHVPVCRASDHDGDICGENINRVESPADFVMGESDCCHKHRIFKKPRLKLASQ